MRFLVLFAFLLSFSAAASAEILKKPEVPLREDAGLITAEYYLATGKYMQAVDVLGGVLQRHPTNADAYTYIGFAYHKMKATKKAAENYTRALKINPRHLGANRYMAALYLDVGDRPRAMEQLQVIKLICGGAPCAEQDEVEADINRFKKPSKKK